MGVPNIVVALQFTAIKTDKLIALKQKMVKK